MLKLLIVQDRNIHSRLPAQISNLYPNALIETVSSLVGLQCAVSVTRFGCLIVEEQPSVGIDVTFLANICDLGVRSPVVYLTSKSFKNVGLADIDAIDIITLPAETATPDLLSHAVESALRLGKVRAINDDLTAQLNLNEQAIAAASSGIIICDPYQADCPIVYCNPAFTKITGYTPDDVIGKNCRFLQGHETDDHAIQIIRQAVRTQSECTVLLKNYRKNGSTFWNEFTLTCIRDSAGTLTHYAGVQNDVTERIEIAEFVNQLNRKQFQLVRDVLASVTGGTLVLCHVHDELPAPLTAYSAPIPLAAHNNIRTLRNQATDACDLVGLPDDRKYDFDTAVGEAAMNAVVHSGSGWGQVFTDERGVVQVRIEDNGRGINIADLPNATLRRGFSTAGTLGHGFKMMLSTAKRVFLLTGSTGTTVVLEQEKVGDPTEELFDNWIRTCQPQNADHS